MSGVSTGLGDAPLPADRGDLPLRPRRALSAGIYGVRSVCRYTACGLSVGIRHVLYLQIYGARRALSAGIRRPRRILCLQIYGAPDVLCFQVYGAPDVTVHGAATPTRFAGRDSLLAA